ncbi:hypothetical protein NFI96_003446 [Prochilodus magdalenae]|nr:hypothetical protein NFI96_003446 [Prochilodus magdalenae]
MGGAYITCVSSKGISNFINALTASAKEELAQSSSYMSALTSPITKTKQPQSTETAGTQDLQQHLDMSGASINRNLQSPSVASSAAKRAKSLQTPPAYQDIQPVPARHVSLRDMVLTPARVPPFTIPPLCAERRPGRCSVAGGPRRHTLPASAHSPRTTRALSCRCNFSALGLADMEPHTRASSDPATRAAMSLLHLAKITTPYGFITLGESPCVGRRESLFFQELQPQPGPGKEEQQYLPSCMKSRSESSLQSCDTDVRCCVAHEPENHLPTSHDCTKAYKCAHLSGSSPRKGRLKYLLKKRFAA